MNQTIEQKKEYLRSYWNLKQEAFSKAELIEHIRSREMGKALAYSAVPISGSNQRDLSDFAVKMDDAIQQMQEANRKAVERMKEIIQAIDDMDDVEERILLRKRYIFMEHWEQIAVEMHLSWRSTFRKHGSALEHFEIPNLA